MIAQNDLPAIMDLSRAMLEKAEAGAWDELIGLESRRSAVMARYFDAIRDTGPEACDAERIRELRALNDHILEIGRTERRQLMETLSESRRQHRAVSRYRQVRGG